jgi:hypothetical protein
MLLEHVLSTVNVFTIYAPHFSFGVASPAHLLRFAVFRAGIPLFRAQRFVHSPAVYLLSHSLFSPLPLSFLLCSLRCFAPQTPSFGVSSF